MRLLVQPRAESEAESGKSKVDRNIQFKTSNLETGLGFHFSLFLPTQRQARFSLECVNLMMFDWFVSRRF
jgi:hypothetical protein